MPEKDYDTFASMKERLDEIVDAVSDESLPLDDALSLYEEAVALGLRASDLLEADIDPAEEGEAAETPESGPEASDATSTEASSSDGV